jgi:hypothetical protein
MLGLPGESSPDLEMVTPRAPPANHSTFGTVAVGICAGAETGTSGNAAARIVTRTRVRIRAIVCSTERLHAPSVPYAADGLTIKAVVVITFL